MTDRTELEAAEEPADPRTLSQRLVSPHAFDGNGPVPVQVVVAGRDVAKLHDKFVRFVNQWTSGADRLFTNGEIRMLLDAAALQAEWMRELYEARDLLLARLRAAEAVCEALTDPASPTGTLAFHRLDRALAEWKGLRS